MKKFLSMVLVLAMVISCFSCVALAEDEIKITLNGTALTMDQPPVIVGGRTLVPLRAIFEALGATVSWDDATKTAMGVLGSKTISLQIDNKVAIVDGKDVTLDVPAQIINSRTLVPVRFISESLGLKVDWDNATRTVIIEGGSGSNLYKEWTFDNLTSFEANKDYILGGAYPAGNISVSDKYDANGNGKALLFENKDQTHYRTKIKNVFTKDDLGKTFTIEAKILSIDADGIIRVGLFSDAGTDYAIKPFLLNDVKTVKDKWVTVSFTYKHENEIVTQLGFGQPDGAKLIKTFAVDDIKIYEGKNVPTASTTPSLTLYKEWAFDNLTSFEANKDYILGGAYPIGNISVSDKYDTNGNGKALLFENKDKQSYRTKIKNVFTKDDLGKTFTIEAKILSIDSDGIIRVGLFSDINTEYAIKPFLLNDVKTEKGKWVTVSFTYKHENEIVTQLGFGQPDGAKLIKTFAVDDIKIYEGVKEASSNPRPVKEHELLAEGVSVVKDGKRPVPTNFKTGKNYEDIIYYDKNFQDNDELIKKLPKGEVIVDDSAFGNLLEVNKEFGTVELVTVEGMPFTKALRATCTKIPPNAPYQFQSAFKSDFLKGKAQNGDILLLKFYMRTINSQKDESGNGHIMPIIEMHEAPNSKKVASDIIHGNEWKEFYFPFEYDEAYTRGTLRFGYAIQTVEIGGYEIINYKKDVTIDKLPTNAGIPASQREDSQWRRDAWERIEKIRKSDIKVIVKDASGNVIPNADVKVNMYEAEFEWGVAIGNELLTNANYQKALSENFNTVVCENDNKWNYHLKSPNNAKNQFDVCKLLGIKNFRGHTLMWDKSKVAADGVNSAMPDDLPNYFDDYDKLQEIINKHIVDTMKEFEGTIGDWDVLNEAQRYDMRMIPKYGTKIIKEWFDMARNSKVEADLYYNDYIVNEPMIDFVKSLIDAGVDFDGVGLQSHHNQFVADIRTTMSWWQKIADMGKRLKITEYDFATDDEMLQASYTRDFMIAVYSMEAFDGFVMWGMKGGANNERVLYTGDFTPRLSLEVWQDLIYNKWWTNEEGKTNANGEFTTRAFHGDYDVTASYNGKTKTVNAQFYKGTDNTIVITLD